MSVWPLLLAATLLAAPVACRGSSIPGGHLIEGANLLAGGAYAAAESAFAEAAESDVLCAEAVAGQAAAQLFAGDATTAQATFANAAMLDAGCVSALLGQGAAQYRLGRVQDAMTSYRQALGYQTPYRGAIRACVAHLACMQGFYRTAELDSESAVAEGGSELAVQTLAASCIGQGRAEAAMQALCHVPRDTVTAYPGLAVRSPLFADETAYFEDHRLDESVRLADLLDYGVQTSARVAVAYEPDPMGEAPVDGLRIDWPRSGSTVDGAIEVSVATAGGLDVDYIALLLGDRFMGISNAQPYRVYVDTRNCQDGVRELRVEAYGRGGTVVAQTSCMISVANGARTLTASEQSQRDEVDLFLQECLLLRADPVLRSQLYGRALEMAGRLGDAVAAYEYGFSYNPQLGGLRGDLLLAYCREGLLRSRAQEIHRLRPGMKQVALTFDDGPHPVLTPVILDLLDQYGAKATFLLVGKQAETYPELVRMIAERGHEIGNHSYSHRNLTTLSGLEIEREIVMTRQIIRQACGRFVTLFRPPGGHYNATVRRAAQVTGSTTVFWNENIGKYNGGDPRESCSAMLAKIGQSSIVLLHNGYDATPEVLPLLLPELRRRGYRMDTVSALSEHEPFALTRVAGVRQTGRDAN